MIPIGRAHAPGLARLLLVAAIAAACGGCATWKADSTDPEVLLKRPDGPRELRLTLADGSVVEVRNPAVRGDSLIGATKVGTPDRWDRRGPHPSDPGDPELRVALADIRRVEVMKTDKLRTAVAIAAGVGATVLIVAAITSDKKVSPPPPSSGGSSGGGGGGDGCLGCSCPLIYSYDGQGWVLDSGTFGGAFLRALEYTDYDILEGLESRAGDLRLRLQAGDKETDHIDDLAILAVDHDPSTTIATDPDGRIRSIVAPAAPVSARDSRGRDALSWVRTSDGRCWESALAIRDTSAAGDLRETLTLEFARPPAGAPSRLVLRANKTAWAGYLMRSFVAAHGTATSRWYATMDAEPSRAAGFRRVLEDEVHLNVLVREDGRWVRQGSIWGGGPEIPKTHVVPLDLSRSTGDVVRIRLESAPSFWLVDWAALDSAPERPLRIREVPVRSALANDGRDAAAALGARDGDDLVLEVGGAVEIALEAPPRAPGLARSYVSRTTGWYRFHAPETGPPDRELLGRLLGEPRGISRMSVAWMNRSIRSLESMD